LDLRLGEYIRETRVNLLATEIHWLDENKQQQHKAAYFPPKTTTKEMNEFIQCELGLDFNFEVVSTEALIRDYNNVKDLLDNMEGNRLYLRRATQKAWDDTSFKEVTPDTLVVTIIDEASRLAVTTVALEDTTFLDIAEDIAEHHPEHKGRVFVDSEGMAFDLEDRPILEVPRGVTLITFLSKKNNYTGQEVREAIAKATATEKTAPDAMETDRYEHISTTQ
jgi:hypothetical protein